MSMVWAAFRAAATCRARRQCFAGGQGAFAQPARQVFALGEHVDHEGHAGLALADLADLGDARMLQRF